MRRPLWVERSIWRTSEVYLQRQVGPREAPFPRESKTRRSPTDRVACPPRHKASRAGMRHRQRTARMWTEARVQGARSGERRLRVRRSLPGVYILAQQAPCSRESRAPAGTCRNSLLFGRWTKTVLSTQRIFIGSSELNVMPAQR